MQNNGKEGQKRVLHVPICFFANTKKRFAACAICYYANQRSIDFDAIFIAVPV